MVFNALKRLIKPEYRIVACTDCKVYYVQKYNAFRKRWEYVCDDSFGIFASEFARYSGAAMFIKGLHRFRSYKLRLLVVNKCDV